MTLNLPPQTSGPVPRRWRWHRVLILLLLAAIGASGWHAYTWRRAFQQLYEAGFQEDTASSMPQSLTGWEAVRNDWHQLFRVSTWEVEHLPWMMVDSERADGLRNLDGVASALRRINPESLRLEYCPALQNVDGLKGLTSLKNLSIIDCPVLQNLGGLKGLVSLKSLFIYGCPALQNTNALNELPGLRWLTLTHCTWLRNADALKDLTRLEELKLTDGPSLRNVDGLKELKSLKYLALYHCAALQDVNVLKELTSLLYLDLEGCSELHEVAGLKRLMGLKSLNLQGCTKIPPEEVAALKTALPNTDIDYP